MRNIIKIFLSFLLIYEPLAYWILNDSGYRGICRTIFSSDFCGLDVRYIIIMATPIILMAIYLMWENQIKSIFTKKQKKSRIHKPKQRFINPFEALGRYFKKFFIANQTASRSEYFGALILLCIIGGIIGQMPSELCKPGAGFVCITTLWISYIITILSPLLIYTLNARRWNDIGWNGKIMAIVPVILFYALIFPGYAYKEFIVWAILVFSLFNFIAFCFPSKFYNNKYRNKEQDTEEKRLANLVKQTDYDDEDD